MSSSWRGWQIRGQGQPILPGLAICDGDDLDTNTGYLDGMGSIPGVRSVLGKPTGRAGFPDHRRELCGMCCSSDVSLCDLGQA